jgi:hypothetical protein
MKHLRRVSLAKTKVTPQGVASLKQAIPAITVDQ